MAISDLDSVSFNIVVSVNKFEKPIFHLIGGTKGTSVQINYFSQFSRKKFKVGAPSFPV